MVRKEFKNRIVAVVKAPSSTSNLDCEVSQCVRVQAHEWQSDGCFEAFIFQLKNCKSFTLWKYQIPWYMGWYIWHSVVPAVVGDDSECTSGKYKSFSKNDDLFGTLLKWTRLKRCFYAAGDSLAPMIDPVSWKCSHPERETKQNLCTLKHFIWRLQN